MQIIARRRNKAPKHYMLIIVTLLLFVAILKVSNAIFANSNESNYHEIARTEYDSGRRSADTCESGTTADSTEVSQDKDTTWESEYVSLTDDEIWCLACLIWLEGRGESVECQKAICSVVVNRYLSDPNKYNTLFDVIYEEGQFSPAYLIEDTTPDDIQIGIVHNIMMEGPTIPSYVTFFRADHYHCFGDLVDYTRIDNTYFSYSESLYNVTNENVYDEED